MRRESFCKMYIDSQNLSIPLIVDMGTHVSIDV